MCEHKNMNEIGQGDSGNTVFEICEDCKIKRTWNYIDNCGWKIVNEVF